MGWDVLGYIFNIVIQYTTLMHPIFSMYYSHRWGTMGLDILMLT